MQFIVFKDKAGHWRWQLQSANSKIIADSGEGYINKADCLHGVSLVKSAHSSPVVDGALP